MLFLQQCYCCNNKPWPNLLSLPTSKWHTHSYSHSHTTDTRQIVWLNEWVRAREQFVDNDNNVNGTSATIWKGNSYVWHRSITPLNVGCLYRLSLCCTFLIFFVFFLLIFGVNENFFVFFFYGKPIASYHYHISHTHYRHLLQLNTFCHFCCSAALRLSRVAAAAARRQCDSNGKIYFRWSCLTFMAATCMRMEYRYLNGMTMRKCFPCFDEKGKWFEQTPIGIISAFDKRADIPLSLFLSYFFVCVCR